MGFDFEASQRNAAARLGADTGRARRRDSGLLRLDPHVIALVREELLGQAKPDMSALHDLIKKRCALVRRRCPSRSSLYTIADKVSGHTYLASELPVWVRDVLHNVDPTSAVPGRQVAFACINSGDTRALSFAASLPWLDLFQARRMRGFRAKSVGLLDAICAARGI